MITGPVEHDRCGGKVVLPVTSGDVGGTMREEDSTFLSFRVPRRILAAHRLNDVKLPLLPTHELHASRAGVLGARGLMREDGEDTSSAFPSCLEHREPRADVLIVSSEGFPRKGMSPLHPQHRQMPRAGRERMIRYRDRAMEEGELHMLVVSIPLQHHEALARLHALRLHLLHVIPSSHLKAKDQQPVARRQPEHVSLQLGGNSSVHLELARHLLVSSPHHIR
mmetsp:Transcript_49512/g.155154  ORF Transcript_49512/g.155154 Transcript_49512/m.155154 type:complete len:223 (+) Transcript_49512:921-1589(+)